MIGEMKEVLANKAEKGLREGEQRDEEVAVRDKRWRKWLVPETHHPSNRRTGQRKQRTEISNEIIQKLAETEGNAGRRIRQIVY